MAEQIKPIETSYKGYRFRSRLEARWAVLLDHLGVEWQYEAQGYELPSGARYLPDFWLPGLDLHAEVKGSEEALRAEGARYAEAVQTQAMPGQGLMFLGPVPDASVGVPRHFVLTTHDHCCGEKILCLHVLLGDVFFGIEAGGDPGELIFPCTDMAAHGHQLPMLVGDYRKPGYLSCGPMPPEWTSPHQVIAAYRAARSARFEHGETPVR